MDKQTYTTIRIYLRDVLPLNVLRLFYADREKQSCDLSDVVRFLLRDFSKDMVLKRLESVLDAQKDN